MPKSSHELEIANVTCKFGNMDMLDLYDETVEPAFFTPMKRKYGDTKLFFHQVEYVKLDESVLAIAGRFVKDTILESEQIFENGELKKESETLPSSPSSLFVLILNSHRLLFVREHRGSPTVGTFGTTLARFLKIRHFGFLKAKSKEIDPETGRRRAFKELLRLYPYPTLDVVPVASRESLSQFIHRFHTLERIKIKLLPTNSELDNGPLFKGIRDAGDRIHSQTTALNYENKKGLKKGEAIDQLSEAVKQGNHELTLIGHDSNGGAINGSNDHFKLKVPIESLPRDIAGSAKGLYTAFSSLALKSILTVPEEAAKALTKVKSLISRTSDGHK